MSDKRKPELIILIRKPGKKSMKLELFFASKWKQPFWMNSGSWGNRYRIRFNGKWFDKIDGYVGKKFFTKWEFRDLLFKSLKM